MLRLVVTIVIAIAACVPPPTVSVIALPSLMPLSAAPQPETPKITYNSDGKLVLPPPPPSPPRLEESVDLWFESRPERPIREMALIEVYGRSIEIVLRALRRQGAFSNCDGLIVRPPEASHYFITVAAICVTYVKA
jgi:hypothetical protein